MPGGKREGSGRPKGAANKTTVDIKALAQSYGPAAIRKLAQLSGLEDGVVGAESEAAQIAATKELLDRGYGKSTQLLAGDADGVPIITQVVYRWDVPQKPE